MKDMQPTPGRERSWWVVGCLLGGIEENSESVRQSMSAEEGGGWDERIVR